MNAVETLEKVLGANVLLPELIRVPLKGASESQIASEETAVGRNFSPKFRAFLRRWNGIDIEILRLYGCDGAVTSPIRKMQAFPLLDHGLLYIGSDPAGFLFGEDGQGFIFSRDVDGGRVSQLAADFDDFICRLVFGPGAETFAGPEWGRDLRKVGFGK